MVTIYNEHSGRALLGKAATSMHATNEASERRKETKRTDSSRISVEDVEQRLAVHFVGVGVIAAAHATQPGDVGVECVAEDGAGLREAADERQPEVERPHRQS